MRGVAWAAVLGVAAALRGSGPSYPRRVACAATSSYRRRHADLDPVVVKKHVDPGRRDPALVPLEGIVEYDPVVAADLLWRQPGRWMVRNVQIFVPLTIFVASVGFDVATGVEEKLRPRRAAELTTIISGLGPALIKAGQALASRPDLLPSEYLRELQKLQDRVPAFDSALALSMVEESLNVTFRDVYELVDREPIAAASIGQVYKARLVSSRRHDTGGREEIVALKVQRPNCEQIIGLDLFILRWYAKTLASVLKALFGRDLDLTSVIDDFGRLIYQEIDYRGEAANCQRFAALYATANGVTVPRIYADLTSRTVLTMEWIDGERLVDGAKLVELTGQADAPETLVDALVQCSLRQMLDTGFFHADPHAGNLLATANGTLCYLDFGMMSTLDESQRLAIIEAVVHLVNRDFESLAILYKRMGFIAPNVDTTPIVRGLQDALPDVLDASVGELNVKNIFNKLGDVMYTFPFKLPPFYIAIIRCLGVLEGVAIQMDPSFRILSDAYPYIAARLLTDEAPELKAALKKLLFKDDVPQWGRLEGLVGRATTSSAFDPTDAVEIFAELVNADDASVLRANLIADVVDGLDILGVDAARETLKVLFRLDLPPPPPWTRTTPKTPDFVFVPGAPSNLHAASSDSNVRLAEKPATRLAAAEIAAQLAERIASRAIRLAIFQLTGEGAAPADSSSEKKQAASSQS